MLELGQKIWQQFYLVALSTLIAFFIGIPLGILISYYPRIKTVTLNLISTFWTIPSLVLVALMIPLLGIGIKPAILTLSLYALLPILRNTVTGLENIPAANPIESAKALGFSPLQQLWIVELPLALPHIISGVKTAVSITVGIATLAAFIGAGGLGDFINRGLSMNDTHLLLLGAIPAALMALIFDFTIGKVEKIIVHRKHQIRSYQRLKIFFGSLIAFSCFAIVAQWFPYQQVATNTTIRIATKNFTEQYILGELISQMIEEKTKLNVERHFNLGETAILHSALLHQEIDVYPEYTGTAFLNILNHQYNGNTQQISHIVQQEYLKNFQLVWLPPFGFSNSQAIAVKQNFAEKYNLKSISDLKILRSKLRSVCPLHLLLVKMA